MTISGNYANSVAFSTGAATMRSPVPVPPVIEPAPAEPGPSPEANPDLPKTTLPGLVEAPPVGESDRAAKLFAKLDVDGDGSVTKSEFTQGAKELLRRTHRPRHEGSENDERSVRRAQRLERRLDRLFDRVDANHDGRINAAELTEALLSLRPLRGVKPTGDGSSQTDPTAAALSTVPVTTTVSAVVAVQQYTRASQGVTPQGSLETAA